MVDDISPTKLADMGRHHRQWALICLVLVVVAALAQFPPKSQAQDLDDDGHSYLRIVIDGHALTNFVNNQQYQKGGWLAIEPVLVKSTRQTHEMSGNTGFPKGWELLSAGMKSGHHGPGTLDFGVGDNGGLDPLFTAQKNGTIIPSADLDLFPIYGEARALIGKYLIKRIRIVAVEDVPASACGMYDVTIRFQSIEPRAAK